LIEGKLTNLRALEREDLKQLRDWRNDPDLRSVFREYRLLNIVLQERWFESLHKKNPPDNLMFGIVDRKNKLIGVTGLTYINWKNRNAELSFYLGDRRGNTAIEDDAVQMILDYGFNELSLHRIWVEVYEFNERTIKMLERNGFKKEGTIRHAVWRERKWWNSYLYSMLQSEFSKR